MTDLEKEIKFSENWNNKLDAKAFTTFRKHTGIGWYEKGHVFNVMLKGQFYCKARVIDTKIVNINAMNEWQARLDTGMCLNDMVNMFKKMYPGHENFLWILFERL